MSLYLFERKKNFKKCKSTAIAIDIILIVPIYFINILTRFCYQRECVIILNEIINRLISNEKRLKTLLNNLITFE